MKQDIWDIYFQTRVRNGFNAPEPADHHFAPGAASSLRLCRGVATLERGGVGRSVMGTEEGGEGGDELLQ